jgi:signal transduction histidine kinase
VNAATLRLAIGGPNALTRWSLIVWLSVGILLSTFAGLRFGYALPALLPVVLGVHLLLIPPLLVCRAIMIRTTVKAPRPWLGLGMFAFLGGLRTLLPLIVAPVLGVTLSSDADGFALPYLPSGMASAIVILGVVAVVVDGSRRNRAIVENLTALDAEFERARAFDEAELADLEARSVDQISSMLEEELRQVQSEFGNAPDQAATRIRMLATDIARPLSHSLAQGYELVPEAEVVSAKPPRWERIRETIAEVRPAQPLVPFLLIELVAVAAVVAEPVGGVGFAALMMLLLGGIVFALSWVLARFWPTGRTTVLRLIALIVLYALIGFVATWVRMVIVEWSTGIYNPLWITPFLLIVVSMGVSFTTAIQTRQLDDRDRLAMSVARNAQLNSQVRERMRRAQRRIAKLLHSNVQAELIASAKLLASRSNEAGDASSEDIDVAQELHRLTSAIHDRLVPSMEPAIPAKERVLDLTSLWSGILDVKLVADGEVWTALEQDPDALDGVIDVVAEGLTNAVRHGNGPQVAIDIKNDVHEITVLLTSFGFLTKSAQPGFGSEILTEVTTKWALAADGDQVRLTSHIPYLPARI